MQRIIVTILGMIIMIILVIRATPHITTKANNNGRSHSSVNKSKKKKTR